MENAKWRLSTFFWVFLTLFAYNFIITNLKRFFHCHFTNQVKRCCLTVAELIVSCWDPNGLCFPPAFWEFCDQSCMKHVLSPSCCRYVVKELINTFSFTNIELGSMHAHLGSLESTQKGGLAPASASSYSYSCLVLSKLTWGYSISKLNWWLYTQT